jgi:hypothetical protein
MSGCFGPLDPEGRVPQRQQTRVAAFLISAHGALARQFALTLPLKLDHAWQTELNAQFYREAEIVSLLMRATAWMPDLALGYMAAASEIAGFRSRSRRFQTLLLPGPFTLRRSHTRCMAASGQRRCYPSTPNPMIPSSSRYAVSNSRVAVCCRLKSCF